MVCVFVFLQIARKTLHPGRVHPQLEESGYHGEVLRIDINTIFL